MDGTGDGSPPNSMYILRCGEMFPKPQTEKEHDHLAISFTELPGEGTKYIGCTLDGVVALTNYRIYVKRRQQEKSVPLGLIENVQSRDLCHLFINCKDANTVKCSFDTAEKCSDWQRRITLAVAGLINLNSLFAFPFYAWSSEQQSESMRLSASRPSSPANINSNHHHHHNHTNNGQPHNGGGHNQMTIVENEWTGRLRKISANDYDEEFRREVDRLQFNLRGAWRISKINEDFKLCPSYPRYFLVPTYITDEALQGVASFRSSRRIPIAVWRHKVSGAIIARCSQPEVGWLGWRNSKDEELLQAFVHACAFDRGEQQQLNGSGGGGGSNGGVMNGLSTTTAAANGNTNASNNNINSNNNQYGRGIPNGGNSTSIATGSDGGITNGGQTDGSETESVASSSSPESSHEEVQMDKPKKMLIVDARSYASAVTNRARGGGCECIEYYPFADIQFMNLANIHAIRKSFGQLRQLCASPPDMTNWLSHLEKTLWLQYLSGLLAASVTVCRAIEVNGRPVVVHCSDGWDRTPQIVATAQLCLDPYYRTVAGFRTLVEREWLSFGHKFGDRCGHGPNSDEMNERCPVFLQWLDCVHQIHVQFPCSFEFSIGYLIKLAQHSHSCLFGTFLGNTVKERIDNTIFDRTYSVWPFLSGPMYKNPLYVPNRATVLWPAYNLRDLTLWNEVYLGNLNANPSTVNVEQPVVNGASGLKMEENTSASGTYLNRIEVKLSSAMMGTLNLEVDCDEDEDDRDGDDEDEEPFGSEGEGKEEPKSPMSKTRSYSDLLEVNGGINTEPQRRCSDPTVPIELLKQQQHQQMPIVLNENTAVAVDINTTTTTYCDNADTLPAVLPNTSTMVSDNSSRLVSNHGDMIPNNCSGTLMEDKNTTTDTICGINDTSRPSPPQMVTNGLENAATNQILFDGDAKAAAAAATINDVDASEPAFNRINSKEKQAFEENEADAVGTRSKSQFIPSATNLLLDSVDGAQSQSVTYNSNTDNVMLNQSMMMESVDLRGDSREISSSPASDSIWHGNVETSTDTLVPATMGPLANGKWSSYVQNNRASSTGGTQRQIDTAVDCSIYEQNNYNLSLLNNQSIYEDHPRMARGRSQRSSVSPQLGDISILADVIQTQPQFSGGQSRHRRTSSNSKSENSPHKMHNGTISPSVTVNSRFSTPGGRSPLTPPNCGMPFEKALSCPDGLAHALNEQNLRLQQIIYEHKLREEALQRELNSIRLELLKRVCYQCNNNQHRAPSSNPEEQNTNTTEGAENISVCSWEAVEERCSAEVDAPSKVLWVPDHAVNKCTGCSFEFWIGRRKHHCRSCGNIFCSECSEFFAPLEKLYDPVRLCGPCYLAVTSKYQVPHNGKVEPEEPPVVATMALPTTILSQQEEEEEKVLVSSNSNTTINNNVNNNKSNCSGFSLVNPNYNHEKAALAASNSIMTTGVDGCGHDQQPSNGGGTMMANDGIPTKITREMGQTPLAATTTTATGTTPQMLRNTSYCMDMGCKTSAASTVTTSTTAMHTSM